ncbi:uncharacterized protein [Cicer arietinum]|uniref:uncharacterized protein n=1 Tax=Cicer arietinum TaxID=3827 RepID=UPI00032A77FD
MSKSSTSSFSKNVGSNSNRFYKCPVSQNKKNKQQLHQKKAESAKQDSRIGSLSEPISRSPGESEGSSSCESVKKAYFELEELWDYYKEWSAYGLEVPLTLFEDEAVMQYFVPSLSGIQLYVQHDHHQGFGKTDEESGDMPSKETTNKLVFQYFEFKRLFERQPLNDKVSTLAMEFPLLKKYRSCDILPCSWFSVAWYPIYRIPVGPSLKNSEASFITFHNLTTHFSSQNQPKLHEDEPLKIALPIFGLATYKVKRSILHLPKVSESQQMNSLVKGAEDWLKNLNIKMQHHDYMHFVNHV